MAASKKRVIKSLETLDEELRDLIKRQYPNGYEGSITRISNAKKEPIFVFPLETPEATYLIKIPFTKNSEGEYDVESGARQEFSEEDGESSYAERDEFANTDGNFEEGEGEESQERSSKDPSYEPDFDG